MSDDIVVVDSGEVYETQESSIIAKDEADRAEKWGKLAEERADIATSASFEAIKSKDEAAQYAATTKSNRDYVNSLLNSSGFKAVANDMLATPSAIKTALENANNAAESAENASESAGLAAEEAADAAHYANDSRIWAVGSDTEVNQLAPNQGKHSSKTYADLAGNEADRAQQEADRAKQYVDIGELADKITNCITEIPQDIKLELNNGTLTLKAGSRVYVPNGANKFDEVVISSDKTATRTDSQDCMAWYNTNTGTVQLFPVVLFYSGSTAPTGQQYMFWYDTVNNLCKVTSDSGATWVTGKTFPLCLVATNGSKISGIKQVFNGFGYIGSTVFALPGVKGLIPNGRNADGSLKNIEIVLDGVTIVTNPDTNNTLQYLMLESNGAFTRGNWYYEQTQTPSWASNNNNIWYNPETNRMYYYRSSTNQNYRNFVFTGLTFRGSTGSTTISEFNQAKLPFRAVDQNDFNKLDEEAAKLADNNTFTGANSFTTGLLIRKPAPSTSAFYSDVFSIQVDKRYDAFAYQGTYYTNILKDSGGNYLTYTGLSRYEDGSSAQVIGARSYMTNGTRVDCVITAKALSDGTIQATAPNPASTSNSQDIATTAWIIANGKNGFRPNWGGKVSITRGTDYTAPSNGFIVFYASDWNKNTSIKINSTELFKFYGNVISGTMGCIPVCKGDVVNITGGGTTGSNDIYCPTYFIPFK